LLVTYKDRKWKHMNWENNLVVIFLEKMRAQRYFVWSAISFALNFGLNVFLFECLGLNAPLSFVLAFCVIFVLNFFASKSWIFSDSTVPFGKQAKRFILSTVIFRFSEFVVFLLIYPALVETHKLAVLAVLSISFVLKYFVSRFYIFNNDANV